MLAKWLQFKRDDRVKLNFGYHGFPATEGRVLNSWPWGLEILFDGEDSYRVMPFSMVEHVGETKDQSANDHRKATSSEATGTALQTMLAASNMRVPGCNDCKRARERLAEVRQWMKQRGIIDGE